MIRHSKRTSILPPGKLPHDLLEKMLSSLGPRDPNVLLGPGVGIDSAVVRFPRRTIAVTSDPITLAGDLAAYYCVHVNANDLAVMGAIPQFMTVVGLCPPVAPSAIEKIFRDLDKIARSLDITIIGGHTEITTTVNTPILIATMLGPLRGRKIISSASAKPGDVVIMTKSAAIEAGAIIARERTCVLEDNGFSPQKIRRLQNLLFKPGISIIPEAGLAVKAGCSAMHDATEGGIITALWEMAKASEVRIKIASNKIPVLPEILEACKIWDITPLRAISSGALLATISAQKADRLLNMLSEAKIRTAIIGEVCSGDPDLIDTAIDQSLLPSEDQIVKIYA